MTTSVIVLGKGDLAISVAKWFLDSPDNDLKGIVPVMPEPAWSDSFAGWARDNGVAVVESGHYRDLESGPDGLAATLGISVFYDRIIRPDGIAKFGRLLNIHNAPLPRYRGVSPINWALKNEEVEHGVTIHEITPGIDDGPIVAQVSYSIFPEIDEVVDVYGRALRFAYQLFVETMPLLDRIVAREQDHDRATYYSKQENHRLGDRVSWRRTEG